MLLPLVAALAILAPALQATRPAAPAVPAGPYDLSAVDDLLRAELDALQGDVTVLVRQGDADLYAFTAGAIAPDTKVRLASLSKTVSAGVILSLVDAGELTLDETLAEGLPLLFGGKRTGEATVLDCWAMRHGLDARLPYESLPGLGLLASVTAIANRAVQAFAPGTKLHYDGAGMQASALVATERTGLDWEDLARERILGPCGMDAADYGQFGKNPAVAGGLRASAREIAAYADMVLAGGKVGDERVLSEASVDRLFTDHTAGLPVHGVPFPRTHPDDPDRQAPTYGFGGWIAAKDEATGRVEEVLGAGAWGSYLWMDRRRGLSAVLVVDLPAGSKGSMDAALGSFRLVRETVEAAQASAVVATPVATGAEPSAGEVTLTWTAAPDAEGYRVVGSDAPIEDVFDLATATTVHAGAGTTTTVPAFAHYAVLATLAGHENTALVPGSNVVAP